MHADRNLHEINGQRRGEDLSAHQSHVLLPEPAYDPPAQAAPRGPPSSISPYDSFVAVDQQPIPDILVDQE